MCHTSAGRLRLLVVQVNSVTKSSVHTFDDGLKGGTWVDWMIATTLSSCKSCNNQQTIFYFNNVVLLRHTSRYIHVPTHVHVAVIQWCKGRLT